MLFRLSTFLSLSSLSLLGNENALNRSEYGDVNRIPVIDGCWTNPGFVSKWIQKLTPPCPSSTPLYLFKLGENQRVNSSYQYVYNPKQKMGVNTVAKLFGHLCKLAGVEGNKTPHMMRSYVATKLANDPRVSSAEVASALRHTSLQSQAAYIVPTLDSEMKRVEALGQMPSDVDADSKPAAKKKTKKPKKLVKRAPTTDAVQKKMKRGSASNPPAQAGGMASTAATVPMMPFGAYGAYGPGAYGMPPPNPYAAMAPPNPYAPYGFAAAPPNPYAPYGFAAAPPNIPRPDAAALAAIGLSQAQIEAAMAAADSESSDDEE